MLVKWIRCSVDATRRGAFSVAQSRWTALDEQPGFVLQVGGWDERSTGQACIFGVWSGHSAYDAFMANVHDDIVASSGQRATYRSVTTRLFDVVFEMEGASADPIEAFATAETLRVAHCVVAEARESHFVAVQRGHWAPGMSAAGLSAGWFSAARETSPPEYLVSSAWPSKASHTAYLETQFPRLRQEADVESDVVSLKGSLVALEPSWRVRGSTAPGTPLVNPRPARC